MVRRLPLSRLLVVVTTRPSPWAPEVVRLLVHLSAGGSQTLDLRALSDEGMLRRTVYDARPNIVLKLLEPFVVNLGRRRLDGDVPDLRSVLET